MMPALTPTNLLVYCLQIAAIVVIGGGTVALFRLASPRARLILFRALLAVCLALPFVQPAGRPRALSTPAAPGPASLGVTTEGRADTAAAPASAGVRPEPTSRLARAFPPRTLAGALWLVIGGGIAIRLAWLLVGLIALKRLRAKARPIAGRVETSWAPARLLVSALARPAVEAELVSAHDAIDRAEEFVGVRAEFRVSDAVQRPVTFGALRRVVLLPASYVALDQTEQVSVACHELLHVRRRDWLFTVGEELVRALLWFHPAVWWLVGQVDLSREQLVDQEVVALTQHRQSYVRALVRLALFPSGPVLRPASLFLRRTHLLERVALLSREVRMSRVRFAVSLVLVVAALVAGGRLIVEAFPLAPMPAPATVVAPAPASPALASAPVPAGPPSASVRETVRPVPSAESAPAQESKPVTPPRVLQRVEPNVSLPNSADAIVLAQVTIDQTGLVAGQATLRDGDGGFSLSASDFSTMLGMSARYPGEVGERLRASLQALEFWRFAAPSAPVSTVIGINFARADQSGPPAEPVRIGGNIKAPAKLRDVKPVYPVEAMGQAVQGMVILELTIDGAGIPILAYAVRPVEGLTSSAVNAALRWRFEPSPEYPRRLMTVTVNFTLASSVGAAVPPPPPPPPPPDAVAGVSGGVAGGIVGGVVGGIVSTPSSFGPPPSQWPQATRIGGNIQAPAKIYDVRPVYPPIAEKARVQGIVIIEALIGEDGSVQAARILRSIPLLDQAALDAVRQWRFTPTLLNGAPTSVIMTTTVTFTLQ